jgi:superfamily II DNA or RNA helicase
MMTTELPPLQFLGKLRPSQLDVVEIAKKKIAAGAKKLHIVAPPGSGKTVTGLYLWAMCFRRPALVLSPNSAIQVQWAARTDLFSLPSGQVVRDLVSTDPLAPAIFTSLTYQSVTLPSRGNEDIDSQAVAQWQEKLIERGQAKDPDEATAWLEDLKRHNRDYYEQRLSSYRKVVRDAAAMGGDALKLLHGSVHTTLERLKAQNVGLIICDECHHLLGHWGRVMASARELLNDPIIIGLTATPPDRDGKPEADVKRYDEFFGPIDFEVPVPSVVKDGFLAPYQDLAYFVRPQPDEITYIANADSQLYDLVLNLCEIRKAEDEEADDEPEQTADAEPTTTEPSADATASDEEEKPPPEPEIKVVSAAAAKKRAAEQLPLQPESMTQWVVRVLKERRLAASVMKDWAAFERRDPDFAHAARCFLIAHEVALPDDVPPLTDDVDPHEMPATDFLVPVIDRYVRHRLRNSPLKSDRRLAEQAIRQMRMFGVQITEVGCQPCASPVGRVMAYSKSKCQALPIILEAEAQVLGDKIRAVVVADYEKTSAVSAEVEHLLNDEAGGAIAAFKAIINHPNTDKLDAVLITGSSVLVDDDLRDKFQSAATDWLQKKKFDVQLEMHQEAGFHVISGNGSDWSPRVYVELITELFQRGLTRCLVGTRGLLGEGWDANKINVLVDLTTVTTSMTVNQLRGRSIRLDPQEPQKLANNWDVVCIAPEFSKGFDDYKRFKAKHQTLYGVTDDGAIEKGVGHVHPAFTDLRPELLEDSISTLNEDMLRRITRRDQVRELWQVGKPYTAKPVRAVEARPQNKREAGGFPPFRKSRQPWSSSALALAIGEAVLRSLGEAKLIGRVGELKAGDRAGGYVRVFLEGASAEESELFTASLHEALGPLHRPRYVIPRYVDRVEDTWMSSMLPSFLGQYFQTRRPQQVMLHAVPAALAKNKELVEIYQRNWNKYVSPGEAVFGLRENGSDAIDHARRNKMLPTAPVQEKEVFM